MNKFPHPAAVLAISLSVLGVFPSTSRADTLARYEFNGAVMTPAVSDPNTTVAAMIWGDGLSGADRGFGASNASLYSRSTIVDQPLSPTSTDYVGFTLTANSGYELDLSNISFFYGFSHGTAGGTPVQQATFTLRSSLDGFTDNIAQFTRDSVAANADSVSSGLISLSDSAYQNLTSITFRLFLSDDGVNTTTHTLRLDNIDVQGFSVTSAVPEPSTYAALSGLAALGVAALRRRNSR